MLFAVAIFALIIGALTLYGIVSPPGFIAFARRFRDGPGVWGGFAIRLSLAGALWASAPASATPVTFAVLAVLVALGAVALPLMGNERFGRLVEWGCAQPPWILRFLCVLGLTLGLFLLWSSLEGLSAAGTD